MQCLKQGFYLQDEDSGEEEVESSVQACPCNKHASVRHTEGKCKHSVVTVEVHDEACMAHVHSCSLDQYSVCRFGGEEVGVQRNMNVVRPKA